MRKALFRFVCAMLPLGVGACDSATDQKLTQTQDETLVRERIFHLTLPGKWNGGYDDESHTWTYRGPLGNEAVTVGILERTGGTDPAVVKEDFDAYLDVRRKQEKELGGSALVLTEAQLKAVRDAFTARFDGYDSRAGRRTHTYVIVNGKAAASYYYEAFDVSEADFVSRAAKVLGKIGLIH